MDWIKYGILLVFLSTSLYVHFRGRERLRLLRQLTGASTLTAPYNTFVYLFSAVPNQPMLNLTASPSWICCGKTGRRFARKPNGPARRAS